MPAVAAPPGGAPATGSSNGPATGPGGEVARGRLRVTASGLADGSADLPGRA